MASFLSSNICLNEVSKWPAAGQGLQIAKWLAVIIFPIILQIYKYLSIESPLYTTMQFYFNVLSFLGIELQQGEKRKQKKFHNVTQLQK